MGDSRSLPALEVRYYQARYKFLAAQVEYNLWTTIEEDLRLIANYPEKLELTKINK